MPKSIIPLLACLLLATACHHPRPCPKPQPNCPAATPTRCTPQPRKCCTQPSPTYSRKVGPTRHAVTLSNLMDYLPGIPPGYTSI